MSWFTDIAGKAEDLLNRVDQTAATALQQSKQSSASANNSPYKSSYTSQNPTSVDYSYVQRPFSASSSNISTTPNRKSSPLTPKRKPESDDEKLLRFLNDSETLPEPTFKTSKKLDVSEPKQFKNVDFDPKSLKENNKMVAVKSDSDGFSEESFNPQVGPNEDLSPMEPSQLPSEVLMPDSTAVGDLIFTSDKILPAANLEKEVNQVQKNVDPRSSGNNKFVRELQDRERDLDAAMDAKDTQLAVLKVRFQEADQNILTKNKQIKELETENERLIKELAQNAKLQNKTVEVMQQQLQKTDAELNKIKDTLLHNQNEHLQKIGKTEEEHRHLVESYSALQKKWAESNERNKDLSMKFKQSSSSLEALQQEHNDYKIKAQRILQSKEKLISNLKEGHMSADDMERTETATLLLSAEVETTKQERDSVRDELRRANELLETYRSEIQELEKMAQTDAQTARDKCRNLQGMVEAERLQREELQVVSAQLKEELQSFKDDLARTKTTFQSRVQDREIEIEKLRRQLTAKSLSSVSQEELESRLHALTENLIQKQTLVEALSTEKNSLILQRERLERQYREATSFSSSQQHAYVGINNNDSDRKSKTVYLENPFDSSLTRKVKRVYSCIDSFSIRLGVFFKRYPITRVFVIIYMLLLHFWVMVVLLTYEPEIHSDGYPKAQVVL